MFIEESPYSACLVCPVTLTLSLQPRCQPDLHNKKSFKFRHLPNFPQVPSSRRSATPTRGSARFLTPPTRGKHCKIKHLDTARGLRDIALPQGDFPARTAAEAFNPVRPAPLRPPDSARPELRSHRGWRSARSRTGQTEQPADDYPTDKVPASNDPTSGAPARRPADPATGRHARPRVQTAHNAFPRSPARVRFAPNEGSGGLLDEPQPCAVTHRRAPQAPSRHHQAACDSAKHRRSRRAPAATNSPR